MKTAKSQKIDSLGERVKKAINNQKALKESIDALVELSNNNIKAVNVLGQIIREKNYEIRSARWQAVAITLVIGYVCLTFYAIVN